MKLGKVLIFQQSERGILSEILCFIINLSGNMIYFIVGATQISEIKDDIEGTFWQ